LRVGAEPPLLRGERTPQLGQVRGRGEVLHSGERRGYEQSGLSGLTETRTLQVGRPSNLDNVAVHAAIVKVPRSSTKHAQYPRESRSHASTSGARSCKGREQRAAFLTPGNNKT
jgi:hypothetical protein